MPGPLGTPGGLLGTLSSNPTGTPNWATYGTILDPSQYGALPLSIGTIRFTHLEHPEELKFPINQMLAVQQTIGGGRSVQALGAQPSNVTWTGWLFDAAALGRANALARMAANGKLQPLIWGPYKLDVVVKNFTPNIHNQFNLEYEITVEVVADRSGQFASPKLPDVDAQTQVLFQQANDRYTALSAVDTKVSGWKTTLNNIGVQLNKLGPIASALSPQLSPIVQNVQSLIATVLAYTNPMTGTVPTVSTALKIQLGQEILSNLNLINSNLTTGQGATTVQVKGASCYQMAAQYYGDASLYSIIMQANNLSSPFVPGGTTRRITIPPAKPTGSIQ